MNTDSHRSQPEDDFLNAAILLFFCYYLLAIMDLKLYSDTTRILYIVTPRLLFSGSADKQTGFDEMREEACQRQGSGGHLHKKAVHCSPFGLQYLKITKELCRE